MELKIKIDVKDKIEAYQIVNRLSFEHEVLEAEFEDKVYKFDKNDESKKVSKFLRDDFGKK
uniref:Uncharacterized protein n=1 Tax=Dictyoglomus turgidum TaxID=513050 RepID=A0A7C3WQ88_9BACT